MTLGGADGESSVHWVQAKNNDVHLLQAGAVVRGTQCGSSGCIVVIQEHGSCLMQQPSTGTNMWMTHFRGHLDGAMAAEEKLAHRRSRHSLFEYQRRAVPEAVYCDEASVRNSQQGSVVKTLVGARSRGETFAREQYTERRQPLRTSRSSRECSVRFGNRFHVVALRSWKPGHADRRDSFGTEPSEWSY